MRKASLNDIDKAADIIAETFEANPGINWLLCKNCNRKKAIKCLAEYAFFKACLREGAFISDNEKGVALCYKYNKKVFSLKEIYYLLRFALSSIPIKKIPQALKREAYRKKERPMSGNYFYFWFLGVCQSGSGAGFELNGEMKKLANESGLPIFLETTVEKNKLVYERMGYELYHTWENKSENIKFWFLKFEPPKEHLII